LKDIELLEKYEPVLRFAKSERFFPMDVEHYLARCAIFPSGPQGAVNLIWQFHEALSERIGRLEGGQYFLRFINNAWHDADIWFWWAIICGAGLVLAWPVGGLITLEVAAALTALSAFIVFMITSPIRLRIIPAVLASAVFLTLEIWPIWFFLNTHENYISFETEYYILLPIYIIALLYLFIRTMKFIFERIIPEAPGVIMDMISQATERIAQDSYKEYKKIIQKDPQPVYYGRVVREQDEAGAAWTILQYHFFYAFNDWRLAANGMNHHEGDWEMCAVYLKNDAPYALLLSQHGAGNMEFWEKTVKARDKFGNETTHPVVYVALGSHANYSKAEIIRSPGLYSPGRIQRFLFWVDGLIHYVFLLINPSQKARQIALKELSNKAAHILDEDSFVHMRDERDHFIVSLPMEIASGDGMRVGFQGDNLREGVVKSSSYLRRVMSDRETTRPLVKEWRRVLLSPEPAWVQYQGLWGVKSFLKDESGPPGPKWDRPGKDGSIHQRTRWGKPLKWLAQLEGSKQKGERKN
jgi:hypothetical protein